MHRQLPSFSDNEDRHILLSRNSLNKRIYIMAWNPDPEIPDDVGKGRPPPEDEMRHRC